MGHARSPSVGQPVHGRSATSTALAPSAMALEHIGAPADAAIHQHGHGARHGLRHTERAGGGRAVSSDAPTVVGNDDQPPRRHGLRWRQLVQHALEQNGQGG